MVSTSNRNWKHKNDSLPIAHTTIASDDYTSCFVRNMSDCIPRGPPALSHIDCCDARRMVTARKIKREKLIFVIFNS
jgi:hypothetical protein